MKHFEMNTGDRMVLVPQDLLLAALAKIHHEYREVQPDATEGECWAEIEALGEWASNTVELAEVRHAIVANEEILLGAD